MYPVVVKSCTKCGEEKLLSEFYFRTQRGKRGPMPRCKVCLRAEANARYHGNIEVERERRRDYERRNRDRARARHKIWVEANTEYKREYDRQWREDNPERKTATDQRWREENPERARANARAWAARNRDKVRLNSRIQTHRRRGAPMDSTARGYVTVLLDDPCAYCGAPAEEIDHIEPFPLGGTNEWSNLTASCQSCNRHKSDKPLLTFMLQTSTQTR